MARIVARPSVFVARIGRTCFPGTTRIAIAVPLAAAIIAAAIIAVAIIAVAVPVTSISVSVPSTGVPASPAVAAPAFPSTIPIPIPISISIALRPAWLAKQGEKSKRSNEGANWHNEIVPLVA
ncbi:MULTISPECIES: hypothetical protein [unclassified Devosia]|uniref:hypothetical protein n=1 Tax=unclassified Devosia TaxID=196773 RepID=UPI001555E710|nr:MULTISPECIES: hypothetical protein [unclassified Devosia]